ncbi:MAG: glycosyltransferase family 39 protein [Patescibacteria group bacterium]|nr:glycosyltransferase family 39 protein [Patescibacteria group bacterium]MDD5715649.1 glycosyltransferase family 39 protein [Patescibacteria group bacterium]
MLNKLRAWVRANKYEVAIVLCIVCVGGFVRLYHVGAWMHFGNDEGRDAFTVADIAEHGYVKLVGPAASSISSDFHLGPAFYYLLAPAYALMHSRPSAGAVTVALFSTATIVLVWAVARKFFGRAAGLIAAMLYSVSFLEVYYGRWAWNPNLVPFFVLIIIFALFQLGLHRDRPANAWYLFVLAISLGIVMQLHGTALFAMPVLCAAYLLITRPRIPWKKYLIAGALLIFVNIPLILYEATNRLGNTRSLIRLLTQSDSNIQISIIERFRRAVVLTRSFWYETLFHSRFRELAAVAIVALVVFILWRIFSALKHKRKDRALILCLLWLCIPFCLLVPYKDAIPVHYFCTVFPAPFIIFGWFAGFVWHSLRGYGRVGVVMLVIVLWGLQLGYSTRLLHDLSPTGSRATSYPVTLSEMEQVAAFIKQDSKGHTFNFQSEPSGAYERSYEYVFECADIAASVVPETLQYTVLIGRNAAIPDSILPETVRSTRTIGNVRVIVAEQNRGNGD